MELGTLMLYVVLTLGAGSLGFTIYYFFSKDAFYLHLSKWLGIFCCLMISLTFLLLAFYFLTSDLHIEYVHSYTKTDYTMFYKWGGILAGAKGTILFWVWLISISLIVQEAIQSRKERKNINQDAAYTSNSEEKELYIWVRLIVITVIIAFVILLLKIELFRPTEADALNFYPDGFGLNENLHTPLMIAHPPVEFAGYAFATIPMASAFAYLIRGKGKWTNISLQWARWSWLFFGLGIGIGGLWAYIVLGWGGFWAWDPIETVNLVPWITLTALIHGQLFNHKRNLFRNTAILLAIVTFILSLLATFVTRSGLWISVHAFADVEVKEPGQRLISIMETNVQSQFLITFIFGMLAITAILFTWHLMRHYIKMENPKKGKKLPLVPSLYILLMFLLLIYVLVAPISFMKSAVSISAMVGLGNGYVGGVLIFAILMAIPAAWLYYVSEDKNQNEEEIQRLNLGIINDKYLMMATIILLAIGTGIVIFMLITGVNGVKREVFDSRVPFVAIPLVFLLVVCMVWRSLGRENVLKVVGVMMAAGIIGYFVYPDPPVVGISLPILGIALIFAFFRIVKVLQGKKATSKVLFLAGILLVTSGLLGMLMWGAPPSRIAMFSTYFEPTFGLAVLGFVLSSITIMGGFFAAKKTGLKIALLGGLCGLFTMGFYIGSVLAAFALILIFTSKNEFLVKEKVESEGKIPRRIQWDIRLMWTHIIHLGLIILMIGYVLSVYLVVETASDSSLQDKFYNMAQGDVLNFDGYEFKFVDSNGVSFDNNNGYKLIETSIEIFKEGELLSVARPYMKWAEHMNHYHQFVYVENVAIKDIYFIVRGFYTPSQGWIYSMGEKGIRLFSDEITVVAIELKSLPGISAVWGGLWIMSTGIFYIVLFGYMQSGQKEKSNQPAKIRVEDTKIPDSYYNDLIEKELKEIENTSDRGLS
jgi:cytochrome c-type biogenesis protein CcmF